MTPTYDTARMNLESSKRIYTSLPHNSFRLVHIQRGSTEDHIKCVLQETQFTDKSLCYEALSYVWVSSESSEEKRHITYISVDGESFCITANLAYALRMLRRRDKEVIIWIDALCINQTNPLEKNVQIPRMGEIYSKAKKVIATIIPDNDKEKRISPGDIESLMEWEHIPRSNISMFRTLQDVLNKLLESEYWKRAWIVQEIVLARNKFIQYGLHRIPFSKIKSLHMELVVGVIEIILSAKDSSSDINRAAYIRDWDTRFNQLYSMSSELSIIDFLDGFLQSQCSDRRDHIYAFHNLLPEDLRKNIPICYDKPNELVLCRAFQEIIKNMRNLYIITLRSNQSTPSEPETLPSWCPALGVPYLKHPKEERDTHLREYRNSYIEFSQDGKVLRVKGIVLGEVRRRLPRIPLENKPFKNLESEDTSLWKEYIYAIKCTRFLSGYERISLDKSVLGILSAEDKSFKHLISWKNRSWKKLDAESITKINEFAKLFYGRQICVYECKNVTACDRHDPESASVNKKFHSAIIPQKSRQEDLICAIHGCEQFLVLRHLQDECPGEHYTLVGEAKIFGGTVHSTLCRVKGSELTSFNLK